MENSRNSLLTKFVVAEIILCVVALCSDSCFEFICKAFPWFENQIMFILFDESVHFSLALLSWMSVLHWLKYKGFLSYVWEPSNVQHGAQQDGPFNSIPAVAKDYFVAGCCSCLVDFDHFLELPGSDESATFSIRSFHGATHMSHRGFAHSLLFLILFMKVAVVTCFLIISGLSSRMKRSAAASSNENFTSTSFHPNKKLMLFNHRQPKTEMSESFATSGLTLPKRQYKLSTLYSFSMSIKYVALIVLSIFTHQLRDSKRRGYYLFYLPKVLAVTAVDSTGMVGASSWTARLISFSYSLTGTTVGSSYISTPPVNSFVYLILTIMVPIGIGQIMIMFCGAMNLMAKAEKEDNGIPSDHGDEQEKLLEERSVDLHDHIEVKRKNVLTV